MQKVRDNEKHHIDTEGQSSAQINHWKTAMQKFTIPSVNLTGLALFLKA